MSAAFEVKQLVERLLQLTDGGLVVVDGDGGEDPMIHAVRAVQVKLDALDQHVNELKFQQGEHRREGDAQHKLLAVTEQQQRMASAQQVSEDMLLECLQGAWKRAEQDSIKCFTRSFNGSKPIVSATTSAMVVRSVLQASINHERAIIPTSCFICRCCDKTCNNFCGGRLGRKLFRDALVQHLHKLTGVQPSVVQKKCENRPYLQWVVEPLH
ncbi:hypothetical protein FOA52_002640 [Chlamydomonas sp. UWO 241]|nr:hypothetical protein FOA52_002640 [Chlamydomonas sp. UWO 241]